MQDKLGEAAEQYQRALTLRPNFVEALINLGRVLMKNGKRDEAVGRWRQAVALQPHYPVARMNIGLALKQQGKLDEAIAHLRHALLLKPDYAEAQYNLSNTLMEQGNIAEALGLAQRALAANETPETKFLVASCLRSPLVHPGMGDLRDLLLRALSEPWAQPSDLAPTCGRFLALNDAIRDGIARATKAWPNLLSAEGLAGSSAGLTVFAEDHLLRALLESTPVCEVGLERFATGLRFTLLAAARAAADSVVTDPVLSLYCALARQCFINNYVFAQSDAEIEWARALRNALVAAITSGVAIPALSVVAVAAYVPLHTLPGAESLQDRSWPDAVSALIAQQVSEPIEEQRARISMPVLTAVEDEVSVQVRSQYEENPYPQWVKLAAAGKPQTVNAFIHTTFPQSPFVKFGKNGGVDVLVAGCGTGQHPIGIGATIHGGAGARHRPQPDQPVLRTKADARARPEHYPLRPGRHHEPAIGRPDVRRHRDGRRAASSCRSLRRLACAAFNAAAWRHHAARSLQRDRAAEYRSGARFYRAARLSPDRG